MAAFKFGLEQVLSYRKQLEEQAMLALAQVRTRLDARRRDAENCVLGLQEQRAKLRYAAALAAEERWLINGYITGLEYDLEQASQDIIVLEEECNRCQSILIAKAKDRKLLDKLKAKQAERHAKAETHREQTTNDETATLRYTAASF